MYPHDHHRRTHIQGQELLSHCIGFGPIPPSLLTYLLSVFSSITWHCARSREYRRYCVLYLATAEETSVVVALNKVRSWFIPLFLVIMRTQDTFRRFTGLTDRMEEGLGRHDATSSGWPSRPACLCTTASLRCIAARFLPPTALCMTLLIITGQPFSYLPAILTKSKAIINCYT